MTHSGVICSYFNMELVKMTMELGYIDLQEA